MPAQTKTMIYPGTFNPVHFHHLVGFEYFGRNYEMENGVLLPSYKHPEKNDTLGFDERIEIIEAFLEDVPLTLPVEVSRDEEITKSTGRSIIRECERRDSQIYVLLGLDTVLEKLPQMDDYETMLGMVNLMVNDYDREITSCEGNEYETRIKSRSGDITIPLGADKTIFDSNPMHGLHSTDIREDPRKYLHMFPKKARDLIRKYYLQEG